MVIYLHKILMSVLLLNIWVQIKCLCEATWKLYMNLSNNTRNRERGIFFATSKNGSCHVIFFLVNEQNLVFLQGPCCAQTLFVQTESEACQFVLMLVASSGSLILHPKYGTTWSVFLQLCSRTSIYPLVRINWYQSRPWFVQYCGLL